MEARFSASPSAKAGASLPNYIHGLPPAISADDVEYSQKKGVLDVPEIGLRNQLLRSYVQYVHPYMPSIDLQEFLRPIELDDGSERIRLLLFLAVMFAATAYVEMPLLKMEAYDDRKSARKAFFQKVKVRFHERITVYGRSLASSAPVRFRLRTGCNHDRTSAPTHVMLVRDTKRPEGRVALNRCRFIFCVYRGASSQCCAVRHE